MRRAASHATGAWREARGRRAPAGEASAGGDALDPPLRAGSAPAPDRLLVISQYYWPEPIGSAPYVTDVAEWFAARGSEVTVLTARPHYPAFRVWDSYAGGARDEEHVRGVRVLRLPTWAPRRGRPAQRIIGDASLALLAAGRLLRGRPTRAARVISLCPSIFSVLLGSLATTAGGRHVALVHDIPSGIAGGLGLLGHRAVLGALRATERLAFDRADRVVVLSEAMQASLRAQGVRSPIDVLPIWVDTLRIRPLGESGPAAELLYSGNFGRKQGLFQLLDLAERLRGLVPGVRIVLQGSGSLEPDLRRVAAERRLDNVVFRPLAAPDALNESLNAAALHLVPQDPSAADFAVPSKVYGILAAGRPFVCTARDETALGALVRESRGGIAVPPGDVAALAAAVVRLLEQPALCAELGRRGRAWVELHAAREGVLGRLGALLEAPATPRAARPLPR